MWKIANTVDSIVSSEQPAKLSDEQLQARKHLLQLSENVISLIWSLAEGSHKTLQGVMGMGVEGLLIKMLEYSDLVGTGVTLASGMSRQRILMHRSRYSSSIVLPLPGQPTLQARPPSTSLGSATDRYNLSGRPPDRASKQAVVREGQGEGKRVSGRCRRTRRWPSSACSSFVVW